MRAPVEIFGREWSWALRLTHMLNIGPQTPWNSVMKGSPQGRLRPRLSQLIPHWYLLETDTEQLHITARTQMRCSTGAIFKRRQDFSSINQISPLNWVPVRALLKACWCPLILPHWARRPSEEHRVYQGPRIWGEESKIYGKHNVGQFFHRADMEIKSKERRNRKEMKSQEEREKNKGAESQPVTQCPLAPPNLSPSFPISMCPLPLFHSHTSTHTHSGRCAKTVIHNWDKAQGYRERYTERHRHEDTEKSYNLNLFPKKKKGGVVFVWM